MTMNDEYLGLQRDKVTPPDETDYPVYKRKLTDDELAEVRAQWGWATDNPYPTNPPDYRYDVRFLTRNNNQAVQDFDALHKRIVTLETIIASLLNQLQAGK
jgi:hypothetical protein